MLVAEQGAKSVRWLAGCMIPPASFDERYLVGTNDPRRSLRYSGQGRHAVRTTPPRTRRVIVLASWSYNWRSCPDWCGKEKWRILPEG